MESYLQGRTKMIEDGIMDNDEENSKVTKQTYKRLLSAKGESNLNIIVVLLQQSG
jgi:hypothetical protein